MGRPALSYITTCKGRLAHLKQTLPRVATQPGIECIVVDFGCPEGAAAWVEATHPNVKVVRVAGVEGCNVSRARNMGAQHAGAPWLGFFDADILLAPDFFAKVLPTLAPGHFYWADPPGQQTWGSIICHRDDFAKAGGYDEAYTGWGGEDNDLLTMLAMNGVERAGFPAALVAEIAHGDELRTRYAEVKDRVTQWHINRLYLQVKVDLIRMNGGGLDTPTAKALFTEIQRQVVAARAAGKDSFAIEVSLPAVRTESFPQDGRIEVSEVQKTMRYAVRILGHHGQP